MHHLLAAHEADSLVAFGPGGDKSAADLWRDAHIVANALPAPSDNSHVLMMFHHDRYLCAVAMLGALQAGHAIYLPPNLRRKSIFLVKQRPETVAMLHDTDSGGNLRVQELLSQSAQQSTPAYNPEATEALSPRRHPVTVFTSGSSSEMTQCPKTELQLLEEAYTLGEVFGIAHGDRIVGTVVPGHIYGLLFTVLLPLCRGGAFLRSTPLHTEAVVNQVQTHRASVLVTVPAHLRTLRAADPGAFAAVRRVFSSTAPLRAELAEHFYTQHQQPVIEVFGSSETGGIGWRNRQEDTHWRPLPGVTLQTDPEHRLTVESPFVHPDERPFRTADLAELQKDGTFRHLGRMDGIVKIGGRRVSVREIEDHLNNIQEVEDAAVVAIPAAGARGHQLVAAVVGPTVDLQTLRQSLLNRYDPSVVPRKLQCVERLPRERNGKLTRERFLELFDLDANGKPLNWTLEWHDAVCTPGESGGDASPTTWTFPVDIPEDYAWYRGHFTGYPIMAGAVQLQELILPAITRAFPDLHTVHSMKRVKFTGRIRPGDLMTVHISRHGDTPEADFKIVRRDDEKMCSAGRIRFSVEATS